MVRCCVSLSLFFFFVDAKERRNIAASLSTCAKFEFKFKFFHEPSKRSARTKTSGTTITYAVRKGVLWSIDSETRELDCDLRFMLDGEKVEPYHTPLSLELDDQDQIDCMIEQAGC